MLSGVKIARKYTLGKREGLQIKEVESTMRIFGLAGKNSLQSHAILLRRIIAYIGTGW